MFDQGVSLGLRRTLTGERSDIFRIGHEHRHDVIRVPVPPRFDTYEGGCMPEPSYRDFRYRGEVQMVGNVRVMIFQEVHP